VLKDDHFVAMYSKFQNGYNHIVSFSSPKRENSYGQMPFFSSIMLWMNTIFGLILLWTIATWVKSKN
jgi:hypothetical protein